MSVPVARRAFDDGDQVRFAGLSGDSNPMHMDRLAARRTQAGAPAVHGMHAALWAVDALIGAGCIAGPVARLKVQFQKFIHVGAEVDLILLRRSEEMLRASLAVDGLSVATLAVGCGASGLDGTAPVRGQPVSLAAPAVLDLPDLPGRSGLLPEIADPALACLFPHAAAMLGARRIGALARLSALVGMACPGMHSIFGAFDVRMAAEEAGGVSFAVREVDERFRRTEMAVQGGGISGTVVAFLRHPPVRQRSLGELAGAVGADEFRGVTALVIGGSRGLGALTARLLAAGGARVAITYAVGEAEAREIEGEIGGAFGGGACRILRYDAREDAASQLAGLGWEIGQLYYFATTRIFRQKTGLYDPALFAEFARVYADGFADACAACPRPEGAPLSVFYPSSVAVQDHPREMTEYSMAKAAGELLCADINRFMGGVRVAVSRLPRLLTDQTATVTPVRSEDPLEVMLPIIRGMQRPL